LAALAKIFYDSTSHSKTSLFFDIAARDNLPPAPMPTTVKTFPNTPRKKRILKTPPNPCLRRIQQILDALTYPL
jgi:hypothetical protein